MILSCFESSGYRYFYSFNNCRLNITFGIKWFLLFVEWVHHHHDEDEVDLEEVKWMKRLLLHLTTLHHHHLNLRDHRVSKFRLCHNRDSFLLWPLRRIKRIWIFGMHSLKLRCQQDRCHIRYLHLFKQFMLNHLLRLCRSCLNWLRRRDYWDAKLFLVQRMLLWLRIG